MFLLFLWYMRTQSSDTLLVIYDFYDTMWDALHDLVYIYIYHLNRLHVG